MLVTLAILGAVLTAVLAPETRGREPGAIHLEHPIRAEVGTAGETTE